MLTDLFYLVFVDWIISGLNNFLAPNRWQVIIQNNADLLYKRPTKICGKSLQNSYAFTQGNAQVFVRDPHANVISMKIFHITGPLWGGIHRTPTNSLHKGPVMETFHVSLVSLNKLLNKQ